MITSNPVRLSLSLASLLVLTAIAAHAAPSQVAVSTGYNDEPRNGNPYSSGSGQPLPWYGSANTTFYGSLSAAAAYDPDEDAILLQNMGGSAVTLTAANMGAYDLFTLDSILGPVTLNPGENVILAGVDGSDAFSGLQSVGLTISGNSYSYSDVITAEAPAGALFGASPWIGNSESIPWTPIYTPANSVPDESSTLWLSGSAVIGLVLLRRRLDRRQAARS